MSGLILETFVCSECGTDFEASCLAEFEEKKKKHKCKRPNKRRIRTQEYLECQTEAFVNDLVVDRVEQHNFDKLIRQGVIVAG